MRHSSGSTEQFMIFATGTVAPDGPDAAASTSAAAEPKKPLR